MYCFTIKSVFIFFNRKVQNSQLFKFLEITPFARFKRPFATSNGLDNAVEDNAANIEYCFSDPINPINLNALLI